MNVGGDPLDDPSRGPSEGRMKNGHYIKGAGECFWTFEMRM